MKADYSKYQDVRALAEDELRVAVLGLLAGDDLTQLRPEQELRSAVDSLVEEGIGVAPANAANVHGYRQVISLFAGALLRLAGARVDAIKAEIASRDVPGLESLVRAIYKRLESVPVSRPNQISGAQQAARMGVPSGGQPAVSGRPVQHSSDNPALDYLRNLVDPEVATVRRPKTPAAVPHPKPSPTQAAIARRGGHSATSSWTKLSLDDGLELMIRVDRIGQLDDDAGRRDFVENLRKQLETLFRRR